MPATAVRTAVRTAVVPAVVPAVMPGVVVPSPRSSQDERTHDLLVVRAWARSVGYPIDETSGVPLAVLKAYRRVHGR